MARGFSEQPERSVAVHIDAVDYPTTRDELVLAAEEDEAPPEVMNLMRCLPRPRYESKTEVLRDLAEAARRFGEWPQRDADPLRDRRDIGRAARQTVHI